MPHNSPTICPTDRLRYTTPENKLFPFGFTLLTRLQPFLCTYRASNTHFRRKKSSHLSKSLNIATYCGDRRNTQTSTDSKIRRDPSHFHVGTSPHSHGKFRATEQLNRKNLTAINKSLANKSRKRRTYQCCSINNKELTSWVKNALR